jgi:hypothetical protein
MAVAEPPSLDDIAPLTVADKAVYDAQPEAEPVKKRRGRPPGSKNKTYAGRPVGARRGSSLEKEIGGLLVVVNLPLQVVPAIQKYSLDSIEITALAKAIDAECQQNPTFRKYVEQALRVQGGSSLLFVVGAIAARRVVRAEVFEVPEEIGGNEGLDLIIGQAIAATSNMSVFKVPPPPEPEPTVGT